MNGKIFFSHSWKDNNQSDRIFQHLSTFYDVFYDRKKESDLILSSPIVPKDRIVEYDKFLFLASQNSIERKSNARKEFEFAKTFFQENDILILVYDDTSNNIIRSLFKNRKYISISKIVSSKKLEEIHNEIQTNIFRKGRVFTWEKDILIENVFDDNQIHGSAYLNKWVSSNLINNIVKATKRLSIKENDRFVEKMLSWWFYLDNENNIARTNALYLIAKLRPLETKLAEYILEKYPANNLINDRLFRSFHISQSFLGNYDILIDYEKKYCLETEKKWENQHRQNLKWNRFYFNSKEGWFWSIKNDFNTSNNIGLHIHNYINLLEYFNTKENREIILNSEKKY
jgi:hypothetical protein